MVKLLDESRFKVTLYIANIFKLRKCERVRKRDRNKNYFGVLIYLGHFELVCFIPFRVIFFMIIQVKNIYINWEKLRFASICFYNVAISKSIFFNQLFLHQSNNLLSNVLSNKFLWNVSWPIRFDWITFKYLNFLNWQYMYIVIQSRLCDCRWW